MDSLCISTAVQKSSNTTPIIIRFKTTGIADPEASRLVNIHPNPAQGPFSIKYSLNITSSIGFRIFDISGRLIVETPLSIEYPGTHEQEFNTSLLKGGVYIVRMDTDWGTVCRRLIFIE